MFGCQTLNLQTFGHLYLYFSTDAESTETQTAVPELQRQNGRGKTCQTVLIYNIFFALSNYIYLFVDVRVTRWIVTVFGFHFGFVAFTFAQIAMKGMNSSQSLCRLREALSVQLMKWSISLQSDWYCLINQYVIRKWPCRLTTIIVLFIFQPSPLRPLSYKYHCASHKSKSSTRHL